MLEISSMNGKIIRREIDYTQPYLKGRFVCNAKRDKKHSSCRRRKPLNSLRRNISNSLVLQKTAVEVVFAADTIIYKRQALPAGRINNGHNVCNHLWPSSIKQNKDSSGEWRLPANIGVKKFSLCKQSAAIFKRRRSQNDSEYSQDARLPKAKDVFSASISHKHFIGFRFNCFDNLWETNRRSQGGLQSTQKRSAFLSSIALFRIQSERILARGSATGECRLLNRRSGIFKGMSGKSSALPLSYSGARRFWVFRLEVYRSIRRQRDWLCDSIKDYRSNQRKDRGIKISIFSQRLGSCGFPISTTWLENTASFCGNPKKITSKGSGTNDSFYFRPIFLPGICDQSSIRFRKYLVFLQGTSKNRKIYQGIERRLRLSQNPNQYFPGKSIIFSFTSFRLQYHQLVQADLPAAKISERYTPDFAVRNTGFTGKIGENQQSEFAEVAGSVHFKSFFGSYYSKN